MTRRTTCIARMISAGPAVNAEARKRGPTIAEFQNGRPPKPDVKERGDGVNRDRPNDGDEDKGNVKPLGGHLFPIAAVEQVAADIDVKQQVAVEDDDVPAQHRGGEIELPMPGNQMPEAVGPAEIHRDERQAHDDGRHREQLAEDDEVVELLVVVDVNRDHHHHGGGGHADEEGEVGDVNAPRNLVAHAGDDQAVRELFAVGVETQQADTVSAPTQA